MNTLKEHNSSCCNKWGQTQEISDAERINQETTKSIQRSLQSIERSKAQATDTMQELDKQGKQIEGMERDLETIEDNTKQANRHLRGLKSIWYEERCE